MTENLTSAPQKPRKNQMLFSRKEAHVREKEKQSMHHRVGTDINMNVNMKLYDEIEVLTQNRMNHLINDNHSVTSKSSRRNIFKKSITEKKMPTTARNKQNDIAEL